MIDLLILIASIALKILTDQRVGGDSIKTADSLLEIIAAAKIAYEKETGLPLDIDKIKPYEPIV